MLRIDSHWIWDSWYVAHDGRHHAYFLHAPRSLGHPKDRHRHARIGHATSWDLMAWTVHEPALAPAAGPAWDDQATWTGCVVREPGGRWLMFYTGIGRQDRCREQRIGLAVSTDLHTWRRAAEQPVVTADPRWYETDPSRTFDGVAWRDPWVFQGPDRRWHMLLTASAAGWPATTGGVIGHAVSDDLLKWEVLPPLTEPGRHRCLEVPQVATVDGQHLLVFSVPRVETEGDPNPLGDTWCARAEGPLGAFDLEHPWRIEESGLYAGRLVERSTADWVLMGFINVPDDEFIGIVDDPWPLDPVTLRVSRPSPHRKRASPAHAAAARLGHTQRDEEQ